MIDELRVGVAPLPEWDLATSFPIGDAAATARTLGDVERAALAFRAERVGAVASGDAADLAAALAELDDILAPLLRLTTRAEVALAVDGDDPAALDLLDRCDAVWSTVAAASEAFESALTDLPADHAARLTAGDGLGRYAHHVAAVRASASMRTAPAGDASDVLAALEPVAVGGWERLARQLLGRIEVRDGGGTSSLGAALPALYDGDRERRRRVGAAISRALEPEVELRATALSMSARARVVESRLRGHPHWCHARHVADAVDQREVAALLDAVADDRALVHRWYRAKAGLLGGDLTDADRYAPVGTPPPLVTWPECRSVAVEALAAVHPRLAEIADDLLDHGAVDAAPRPGKRRGAVTFAATAVRPHVLVNFTGQLRDVATLAHELAHAAHARLATGHGPLTAAVPTVFAEAVGLFVETVATDRLAGGVEDDRARLWLVARRVEDQFVAVFRHEALHAFECEVHARAGDGVLSAGDLGGTWIDGQRALYGEAVVLAPGYEHWWSYLDSLFLAAGSAYAYVYGQLAALSMLALHRDDPRRFGERLLAVLAEAGARPPALLLASLGVDVGTPAGWRQGLDVLRDDVDQLTNLAASAADDLRPLGTRPTARAGDGTDTNPRRR